MLPLFLQALGGVVSNAEITPSWGPFLRAYSTTKHFFLVRHGKYNIRKDDMKPADGEIFNIAAGYYIYSCNCRCFLTSSYLRSNENKY